MVGCGTRRGCQNVCVRENSAEGIDIGDHALLVSVGLGPNDRTEDRPVGEVLMTVEGDLQLATWVAVGYEFGRLRSALCS